MGSLSIWHWLVVAVIVLLLFGRGKITELMGDVASGIKAFKKGMAEDEDAKLAEERRSSRRRLPPRPPSRRRPPRPRPTESAAGIVARRSGSPCWISGEASSSSSGSSRWS